ncbi:MAG: hypothetical protein M1813_005491 [Trichoglossum hirsutum]|nr:MAG: hypothetical protein M1813_005491 [Trichoglossum hirsutum]
MFLRHVDRALPTSPRATLDKATIFSVLDVIIGVMSVAVSFTTWLHGRRPRAAEIKMGTG